MKSEVRFAHLFFFVAMSSLAFACGAVAANDPVRGEHQFGPCSECHNVGAKQPDKKGPNLHGVLGKKAGTNRAKSFAYSAALKASGIVWTEDRLDAWMTSPATLVPHTKMDFVGVTRADTRSNIIAYLKQATTQ